MVNFENNDVGIWEDNSNNKKTKHRKEVSRSFCIKLQANIKKTSYTKPGERISVERLLELV